MLTRSGLGASVTAVALLGLGLWWNYEELVIGGVAIAAVVLAAIWVSQRPLRASVDRRVGAVRVPRGDPIHLAYRVRNPNRFRTSRATVIDRCDGEECRVRIDPVRSDRASDFFGTIPTTRRGVFPIGPFAIERVDPFWLAVGTRRDSAVSHITVHPKVYQLIGPQGAVRVVDSEAPLRRASSDPMSGFVSMREYVPGDDPRLIHWPTTARTGSLMIRENVEVRRPEFTVVVDTADAAADESDFEEIVDVAATLAAHAIRSGLDVVVRSTSSTHPGQSTPLLDEGSVLDYLTPVRQSDPADLLSVAQLFVQGIGQSSMVLITGPDGPSSRFTNTDQTLVVRIGQGAVAPAGVALAASDAARFVTLWKNWDQ